MHHFPSRREEILEIEKQRISNFFLQSKKNSCNFFTIDWWTVFKTFYGNSVPSFVCSWTLNQLWYGPSHHYFPSSQKKKISVFIEDDAEKKFYNLCYWNSLLVIHSLKITWECLFFLNNSGIFYRFRENLPLRHF